MKSNRFFIPRLLPVLLAVGIADAQTTRDPLVEESILGYLKVVQDPDGNTNLRTAPSLESKIAGKVLSGAPVFADPESEAGFHMVFLDKEDGTSDRYIHGSRLKPVKDWKTTGPEGDSGRLRYKSFEATVKGPAFVAAEHQITTDADGMVRVDGKIPWGEDGGEPDYDLVLAVSIDGKSVKMPAEATENLYNPNLSTLVLLTPGDPSEHALLMMANSDGAGGYYVVWSFEKGVYRGRALMMP